MAVERNYPRTDDEYPEIMSKMDPLIIRVNPTVLLVGSTSYTAKIKKGIQFTGFHIYASSVGIPIYKEAVDTSGYSDDDTTTGEGSDAWNYIKDKARDWLDDLEKSMIQESKAKNVVELLREIKFQLHYDLSGHVIDDSIYQLDNFEFCEKSPTYIQNILLELKILNTKMDSLNTAISGTDGLNERITNVESKLASIKQSMDSLSNNMSTRLTSMENTLNTKLTDVNTSLGAANTNLGNINSTLSGTVCTTIRNGYEAVANAVEVQTGRVVQLISDVSVIDGVVDRIIASVGDVSDKTLQNRLSSVDANITSLDAKVVDIQSRAILSMDSKYVTWLTYWAQDVYDQTGSHYWFEKFQHLLEDTLYDGGTGIGWYLKDKVFAHDVWITNNAINSYHASP